VLLSVEWSRVDRVSAAKHRKAPIRKSCGCESSDGIGKQLRNVGFEENGWLTNAEQLIDKGESNNEKKTNDPHADGRGRHAGLVGIINDSSHFSIRTVIGDQRCFHLEFVDDIVMRIWICKNIIVAQESLDLFDDLRRKVGIMQMNGENLDHHLYKEVRTALMGVFFWHLEQTYISGFFEGQCLRVFLGCKQIILGDIEVPEIVSKSSSRRSVGELTVQLGSGTAHQWCRNSARAIMIVSCDIPISGVLQAMKLTMARFSSTSVNGSWCRPDT